MRELSRDLPIYDWDSAKRTPLSSCNQLVTHNAIAEAFALDNHFQNRRRLDTALDQRFGKRVFDILLQGPA